jgi:hypothetical protein
VSGIETAWQSFRQLPRAAQWGLTALLGVVLFLVWNDFILGMSGNWNRATEDILAKVEQAAGSDQRLQSLRVLRPAVLGLGVVEAPGREAAAENALNDVINDVIKRHTVSGDSFSYRGPSKMRRGTLSNVIAAGERIERITGELRFESTPQQAIEIVAELESNRWIDAISTLRLTRLPGPRKIRVDLTVEALIVSTERRARLGGT